MNKELELVIEFMKSKKVSLSYLSNKVSIPYGTLNMFRSRPERLTKTSADTINKLYNLIIDIGVNSKEDINNIKHIEKYVVQK